MEPMFSLPKMISRGRLNSFNINAINVIGIKMINGKPLQSTITVLTQHSKQVVFAFGTYLEISTRIHHLSIIKFNKSQTSDVAIMDFLKLENMTLNIEV